MAEEKKTNRNYTKGKSGLQRGDVQRIARAVGYSVHHVRKVAYGEYHNPRIETLVALARTDYDAFRLRLAREKELTLIHQSV
jgi:transcriptional regulator with XRE-family HTH domain